MIKKICIAFGYTVIVIFSSIIVINPILDMIFHASNSVDGANSLLTDAFVIGGIFTSLLCTVIILEEFRKNIK